MLPREGLYYIQCTMLYYSSGHYIDMIDVKFGVKLSCGRLISHLVENVIKYLEMMKDLITPHIYQISYYEVNIFCYLLEYSYLQKIAN